MSKKIDGQLILNQMTEVIKMMDLSEDESDRGMVLITCSLIDNMLRDTLLAFLLKGNTSKDLLGKLGPLNTLFNRTRMAYSLGLISKDERNECVRLIDVRNEFAHTIDCSFDTPEVVTICEKLQNTKSMLAGENISQEPAKIPKDMFKVSSTNLLLSFLSKPFLANTKKLKLTSWSGASL